MSDAQPGDSVLVIDNVSIVSPAIPVTIISQPQDTIGTLGSSATFSVVATGGGDNMMGAIGTGNVSPGVISASFGTT